MIKVADRTLLNMARAQDIYYIIYKVVPLMTAREIYIYLSYESV